MALPTSCDGHISLSWIQRLNDMGRMEEIAYLHEISQLKEELRRMREDNTRLIELVKQLRNS